MHLLTQSNMPRRAFFVYMLRGTSLAKAATDWGRKAPNAAFCTDRNAVNGTSIRYTHAFLQI